MTTTTTAMESALLTARCEIEPGTRCDRCRMASARARITTVTGGVLYLCAHHYEAHGLALESDVTLTVYAEPNVCNCFQCTPVNDRPKV